LQWLQPPGYVHQMIDQTWHQNALKVTSDGTGAGTISAQKSDDGKTLVLRVVNYAGKDKLAPPTQFTVKIDPPPASKKPATVWTMRSTDPLAANPPGQPSLISPKESTLAEFGDGTMLELPSNSYTIVVASL
jgi:alpha-L-arabinofuranosidase